MTGLIELGCKYRGLFFLTSRIGNTQVEPMLVFKTEVFSPQSLIVLSLSALTQPFKLS